MSVAVYDPTPPTAEIGSFDELVAMAAADGPAQKLLVVLVQVEPVHRKLPDGHTVVLEGEGGLQPVMVKDFDLTPSSRFDELVCEADGAGTQWDFLMMAVLPGRNGRPASPADVELHLRRMVQSLLTGGSLRAFAFFDRDGAPIDIQDPAA